MSSTLKVHESWRWRTRSSLPNQHQVAAGERKWVLPSSWCLGTVSDSLFLSSRETCPPALFALMIQVAYSPETLFVVIISSWSCTSCWSPQTSDQTTDHTLLTSATTSPLMSLATRSAVHTIVNCSQCMTLSEYCHRRRDTITSYGIMCFMSCVCIRTWNHNLSQYLCYIITHSIKCNMYDRNYELTITERLSQYLQTAERSPTTISALIFDSN